MLNETKLINILLKQNIPLVEYLLGSISEDYNIDLDELKNKYLSSFRKRKRKRTKKGRITGYTLFLKDTELNEQLRERYKKEGFGKISSMKGEIWKSMSEVDKLVYKNNAKKLNEKKAEEEAEEAETEEKME